MACHSLLVDHILSDLSTITCPSWVAPWAWLSFIELDKAVVCVIRLASFLKRAAATDHTEARLRGATPCPKSGQATESTRVQWRRSYPMLKVRKGGGEGISLVQAKERWLRFSGVAVKRYPTPRVRETQVRW